VLPGILEIQNRCSVIIRVISVCHLAAIGVQSVHAEPPTVIEVRTAAPTIVAVVVQTGPHLEPGPVDAIDMTPSQWKVNSQAVAEVHRYSVPYDELKKGTEPGRDGYPVTIRHRVYLKLKQPLQEGRKYAISTPYGAQTLDFSSRKTFCESIKVNQVGYSRLATSRFANFGVYLGDGGSLTFDPLPSYEVINEVTGTVVASGQANYVKDDTAIRGITSGEHVYRLRLDAVPEGGPYFVSIPGAGRSRSFGVGDKYSRQVAYVATRGLYHQRCGIALERPYTKFTRERCHLHVADTRTPWNDGHLKVPAGSVMLPIRGGYHDAGDFDRRPYHTIVPLLMLTYFEAFPTRFVDKQYNIPESGNGIPDFLDEALWGLLIWEHLQITSEKDPLFGGVRAGTEMDRHPEYGVHSAANDKAPYGTWGMLEDHTAVCAGLFAQASRLVRPYDKARADSLMRRAHRAWDYLKRTAKVDAARSCYMYAALQLYLSTGDAVYHELFKNAAVAIVIKNGSWPEQYLPGNTAAKAQTAHFVSYLLPHERQTDASLVTALQNQIFQFADKGTYMGPEPENEPYPQGVTRFMGFGAATAQGRYADVYAFASLLSRDAAKKQRYINAVSQYADYALGLNPLGMSYYTGLGTDQPVSPLQLDSFFTKYGLSDGITSEHVGKPIGNVPGILVYGPTEGRSGAPYQRAVSDKLYPEWDKLPAQRRFADGWSLVNSNEFTVWETIVWNVVMHGFLFDAGSAEDPLPPAE
jgi:endoglucanase